MQKGAKAHTFPPPPPPEARHPLSQEVRALALALPHAWEDHPWGDVVFKVGEKMFASTATSRGQIFVKANPAELEQLLEHPQIARAPYLGRYGWITFSFERAEELPMVATLLQVSYELVAARALPKKSRRK